MEILMNLLWPTPKRLSSSGLILLRSLEIQSSSKKEKITTTESTEDHREKYAEGFFY
jgi:hypothetical protein